MSNTLLLCVGHFAIPFVAFMSRHIKRNLKLHFLMGLWLVFMHYVDVFWIVMPTLHKTGFTYSLLDFILFLGMGSLFFSMFFFRLKKCYLIPVNDPRINESLNFKNH